MSKQDAPRQRGRVVLRWAVRVVGALVLAVAVFLVWLHSGPGQRWVRGQVERRLAQRLAGTVQIGAVELTLFGRVALYDVHVADTSGAEAVALRSLRVWPSWRSLIAGEIVLDRIELDGLALQVRQAADGTTNLSTLLKPTPPSTKPSTEKPRERRIRLRSVAISDVDVTVDKPDGTRVAVDDLALDGSVDAVPSVRTVELDLSRIGVGVKIDRPTGSVVSIRDLKSGLHVSLTRGAGTVRLSRTTAVARLESAGAPPRELPLELGQIEVGIGEGQLDVSLDQLLAGALVLGSVEVHGRTQDGALAGEQKAELASVHVDAPRLNQLLGRELLATDVDVKTSLAGPPERLAVATDVDTRGGKLRLAGTVDVSDPARPGYDLELTGSDLSTSRLLVAGSTTAPPVDASALRVTVKGRGASREQAEADVSLELGRTTVGRVVIDGATLEGRYEHGAFEVKKLEVRSLGQRAELSGRAELEGKKIKAQLLLSGDPAVALERLRAAGVPAKTTLPVGVLVIPPRGLRVDVEGELDGTLRADAQLRPISVAGGTVGARVHTELERRPDDGGKRYEPRKLSGTVTIDDLDLSELAAMRGKKLPPGVGGNVNGRVQVSGSPDNPSVVFDLHGRAKTTLALGGLLRAPTLAVDLEGKADRENLHANLTAVRDDGGSKLPLLSAVVDAPLETAGGARRLAPNRPLRVKVDMPRRTAADYLAFIPKPLLLGRTLPSGEAELHVDVGGTPAAPDGKFDIDVSAAWLGGVTQRLKVSGTIAPDGKRAKVDADAKAWLDTREDVTLTARAAAGLSESPLVPGPRNVDWQLTTDVRPTELSTIPGAPTRLATMRGHAAAHAELHGNREDVLGDVTLRLVDVWSGPRPIDASPGSGQARPPADLPGVERPVGPIGAVANVHIEQRQTAIDASVTAGKVEALRVHGTVGVAGDGLIPAARDKKLGAAPLAIAVEVPRRPLRELSPLRPALSSMPGDVQADVRIAGTVDQPTAEGLAVWGRFRTLAGGDGRASLALRADAAELAAKIELGTPDAAGAPVTVSASAPRAALAEYRAKRGALPISVSAHAKDVDVRRLVPMFVLERNKVPDAGGRLDWNMEGEVALEPTPEGARIARGRLEGVLDLDRAHVSLGGSKRSYRDVQLRLIATEDALRLEKLSLRESDVAEPKRTLDARGELGWSNLVPQHAKLDLRTHKWLVYGSDKLGPTDAPRAELSADIGVDARLGAPSRRVEATVRSLDFSVPERFARAHHAEVVSLGDVVYLDQHGAPAGKLPIPQSVIERARAAAVADAQAAAPPPAGTPTEIVVHVPKPVHVAQAPLDLWLYGEIQARVGGGAREVRGELRAVKGDIMLLGKKHLLEHGRIVFDEQEPAGRFDLHFARTLHPATLRDISQASGGDTVRLDMTGPLSKPKIEMRGAGNALLYDVAAVLNAGRERQYSEPDMPASSTVQLPQSGDLLALTYMSINLPHNLFLNRFNAWADEDDEPQAYGRVQHMEAERYSADGKTRVRMISRPPSAGQSEAEMWLDWLWANDRNKAVGVGVRGGSRVGGGPGVFFEWSSSE